MDEVPSQQVRRDVYSDITRAIIAEIERGVDTFVMPWHQDGSTQRPRNAATKQPYRGINVLSLWVAAQANGYRSGHWATYRQWRELQAQVRRGERGSAVLFYRELSQMSSEATGGEAHDQDRRQRLVLRTSTVFNADQVDGWAAPQPPEIDMVERAETAEALVAATGAVIHYDRPGACYYPLGDWIDMPRKARFFGRASSSATEAYYATLFHELTHWSGHKSRLDRDLKSRFGSQAYAAEELVALSGFFDPVLPV